MARKNMTVYEWASKTYTVEPVETVVFYHGIAAVAKAQSPQKLASHGPVGVLEENIRTVEITAGRIKIYAKEK